MKTIILTTTKTDGDHLKMILQEIDPNYAGLSVLTKETIVSGSVEANEITTIFSTWYMPAFSEKEIRVYFPKLECIFYAAGTVQYFAAPFLKEGIRIFSAEKMNAYPVAEFVVAQVVLANKGYFQAQRSYKSILWKWNFPRSRSYAESHKGNYEAKVGLIGFGSVGRRVAELLRPYHLKVYAYDPYVSDDVFTERGVSRLDLVELFSICDVISNHLPDIPSTRGMLNESLFSLMKDSVTFINTGRGAQVVEKDLSRALRRRKKACAVLDVTRHEPVFPWSPLLWNRNVFISPHIAGSLSMERKRLVEEMVKASHDVESGVKSDYEVFLNQLHNKS